MLNRVGYTPEISHGMLVQMAEHRKELEKKTKPIMDTLRSYQDLPPVISKLIIFYPLSWTALFLPCTAEQYEFLFFLFRIKLWLHWQLRTKRGNMQLLRSILKMFCSRHLPLQSNVPVVDVKSFVVEPLIHTTFQHICVNLLGQLANGDGITLMFFICIISCCIVPR